MNEDPNVVWPALLGDVHHGSAVQSALCMLYQVPSESLTAALGRLEQETTIGPVIDPSAYQDGRLFENAGAYRQVLEALRTLREAMPDNLYDDR